MKGLSKSKGLVKGNLNAYIVQMFHHEFSKHLSSLITVVLKMAEDNKSYQQNLYDISRKVFEVLNISIKQIYIEAWF